MKNQDYWRQRFEQLENAQNQMGLDALAEITQQYNKAIRNIDKQIRDWYSRFADNNGLINMAEARKFLKGKELKEFKWDLKEYADKARQSAFSDTWEKELLNISAKVHVSRLEALKTQLRQQVEMLFAEQADVMQKSLGESYKSDYYHSAYEIQKGFNVGWDMPSIDQNAINTVLSKPWAPDGYNFSERIWNNKEKLLSELNTVMTQNIMTGAGPQKAIDTLAKKMNTSRSNAGRLVMTESAYFSSLGRQQCFKDLDVEKYEIVATLDRKTSETCRDLDGKVFDIDDYKPGTNAPPMHCWCRSCIVPYFDDMEMLGKRAARDPETGKTILVPEDMTYREWEKKYWNNEHSYRQAVGTPNCNIEYINSKEYKKKFSDLTPDNRLNNLIYERCKAAIIHQNGDYFEDLSVISADECKIVGVTSSKIRNETLYTDKLINDISTYGKGSLISVHNHGTNLPPSGSDLQSAGFRGYRFGIVACHDGKVYYYSTLNAKPFLGILYDKRVDTYRKKPYNVSEEVAMLLALDSVARDYGIEWRELI